MKTARKAHAHHSDLSDFPDLHFPPAFNINIPLFTSSETLGFVPHRRRNRAPCVIPQVSPVRALPDLFFVIIPPSDSLLLSLAPPLDIPLNPSLPQLLGSGCARYDEEDALDNLSVYLKPVIALNRASKGLIVHWDVEGRQKESKPICKIIRGKDRPISYMESLILGTTNPAPLTPREGHNGGRPRRRSALAIAERVGALVSLHRGSHTGESRSRSRGNSDAVSPQSPTSATTVASSWSTSSSTLHLATSAQTFLGNVRSTRPSRDNSVCNTDHEEDHETTSDDIHSTEDSFEFGLLEGDPFANLSAPPSEYNSPVSRSWLHILSSDVITEEPDEREESKGGGLGPDKRGADGGALDGFSTAGEQPFEDEEENDADTSTSTHELHTTRTPASSPERDSDIHERKRSNSLSQRVRNVMQSRPSLPSLSLLANTKIFIPVASSRSGLASRFPSEPWDDPNWSFSAGAKIRNGVANAVMVPSQSGGGDTSSGGSGSGGGGGDSKRGSGNYGSRARNFPSRSMDGHGGGDGDGDGWQPPRRGGPTSHSTTEENTPRGESDEDSDDLPLGQRPNALSAQKSLRKQIKDERRSRKDTIKQAAHSLLPAALISSGPTKAAAPVKLSADDLTARLLHLRANADSLPSSPTGRTAFPTLPTHSNVVSPQASTQHLPKSPVYEHYQPFNNAPTFSTPPYKKDNISSPSLVHASAFAFPSRSANSFTPPAMRRHATDSLAQHNAPSTPDTARPPFPQRSITSFDSPRGAGTHTYTNTDRYAGSATGTQMESRRMSHDNPSKVQAPPARSRADTFIQKMGMPSNYTAKIRQRATSLHTSKFPRVPVPPSALPPLPPPQTQARGSSSQSDPVSQESGKDSYGSGAVISVHSETLMQQRVFIGNMQRFSVVEIGARTNAREVIAEVISRGDLTPEEARSGDWMLFEIANDFGMGEWY